MRDEAETSGVPILLMLLLAGVVGASGLNTALFLAIQQFTALLPDAVWANLTILGDALVSLVLLSLLAFRYPSLLPVGLLAGLVATLFTRSLKPLLAIERPLSVLGDQVHIIGTDLFTYSLPSGHTTAAFVVAGVYALVLQRDRLTAAFFALALLAGFSRISVGAHWPMDVFTGAAIGWFSAWVGWKVAQHWQWQHSSNGQRTFALLFLGLALLLFWLDTGYPQAIRLQQLIASLATVTSIIRLWQIHRNRC